MAPDYGAMSDDDLVKRALHGSESAMDVLWRRYRSSARCVALQYLRDTEDVEDAMVALRTRLHLRLDRYTIGSNYRAWLYQVIRNLARDMAQRRKRHAMPISVVVDAGEFHGCAQEPPFDDAVIWAVTRPERTTRIIGLLRTLPPKLSATAWLRAAGCSYLEIADALDIPLGTVKSRMSLVRDHWQGMRSAQSGPDELLG